MRDHMETTFGLTQQAMVQLPVVENVPAGSVAYWFVPLRLSAFCSRPLVHAGEPTVVALTPLPDASAAVVPLVSFILSQTDSALVSTTFTVMSSCCEPTLLVAVQRSV